VNIQQTKKQNKNKTKPNKNKKKYENKKKQKISAQNPNPIKKANKRLFKMYFILLFALCFLCSSVRQRLLYVNDERKSFHILFICCVMPLKYHYILTIENSTCFLNIPLTNKSKNTEKYTRSIRGKNKMLIFQFSNSLCNELMSSGNLALLSKMALIT
jgi:hypothetical protein